MEKLVLWLEEVGLKDLPIVGGKNASLGELKRELSPKGIKIPDGFVITAISYRLFIRYNRLEEKIRELLSQVNVDDIEELRRLSRKIRSLIERGKFPEELKEKIEEFYAKLSERFGVKEVDVAVRSSATAEDLPEASFAGQQESYLNVRGTKELLSKVKKCFSSLFTERAISYREKFGFSHFEVALAVGVQKMVRSDLASAGVGFSIDTESGFKDVVLINGSYGLGELVVKGAVIPDEWLVFKPTLLKGFKPIIEKKLGQKEKKLVYGKRKPVKLSRVPKEDRLKFCLKDDEVLKLARWICQIEEHYSKKRGRWTPVDVEWAKDGERGELYIVQARPETVHSREEKRRIKIYKVIEDEKSRKEKLILEGIAVGRAVATGRVRVLNSLDEAKEFKEGEVLVTRITDPDWEPVMKKASAVVTDMGGRTCHAAIVARELGIPAVVGTRVGTKLLKSGEEVTVSCAEGEKGYVYRGRVAFEVKEVDLRELPRPKTQIMLNVGNPDRAFDLSFLPSDGVGLAREEFIISNYIGIHPKALIELDKLREISPKSAREIEKRIAGYEGPKEFYVEKLAQGIGKIAAAFYPKPVIVRFSDFKSNEYANLLGGKLFEPKEENPMLGWRGASRYYSKEFKEAFGLECLAVKKVREEMGLKNVIVMVPFCRTPEEGRRVLKVMEEFGLRRGEEELQVYVMCEIPSNVILLEEFGELFDGFSIGSNDLTQLILGVDRDSALVAHIYDERNPAVTEMISQTIKRGKKIGKKVGICGQAPSDYPEFAEFLVKEGIDSISVNPDSLVEVIERVYKIEEELLK